ncbi:NAD(P)-dependent dehydrogenase (short-subunit alcohol dehydrogenase family) [Kineococcus radiotolerans]|uniref:NAD(P)-dependent dehydrogenase (Short-subunit alcohol dehydrogenase family) n=1 Tax=Kineococcus radiotolerans TaxID=131568 RepID=A0A7W4TQI4_KINRA|nr:SDR family NAD(P)-dependent oxidoreductase [Kineococcus radiotolerans]MBB2903217.1 NAD(P)-dependent dehydrogenase (short-subunit alcohol dehydrogenase family) [Kineococcus radiotolerans]
MSQVFLVTGASRGLGREIVRAAAAAGHRVLATARRAEALDDLVAAYPGAASSDSGASGQVRAVALDVTDASAAQRAVEAAVAAFGRLDVVVNNAGYANLGTVEDTPLEDFRAQVETNLLGVVAVTQAALPVLRSQGSGHVIQVSSIGGRGAAPGLSAYQAAKWAVGGFSEVLALETTGLGIKVTVLEPGGMQTDWAGSSMNSHPASEAYEPVMAQMRRLNENLAAGGSASDPARVAQLVLQVAAMEQPPLRLLVGADAVDIAATVAARRAEEDARWRELSLSVRREDAPDLDLSVLGH